MKYRDIDWEKLLDASMPEELKEFDDEVDNIWDALIGDTSDLASPHSNTRQGGGPGIYIADANQQKVFNTIRSEVESANTINNGRIISEPLDPSDNGTYIQSKAPRFLFGDMNRLKSLMTLTDSISLSPSTDGNIFWYVSTGKLFSRIKSPGEESAQMSTETMREIMNDVFPGVDREYVYLSNAELEEIFFNDTGLEYEPNLYNMEAIHKIAGIKDYLDHITNLPQYEFEPVVERGGVCDVRYDPQTNSATVRCFIDRFDIIDPNSTRHYVNKAEVGTKDFVLSADAMMASPAYCTQQVTYMWLDFAVTNIRK